MEDAITIKQLANQAGMEVRTLRRILRAKFPRKAKGKAYEWQVNDPQVDLILKAVANHKDRVKKVNYDASEPKTKEPTNKKKNANAKPAKGQSKTQKPKATKTEAINESVQKGSENDDKQPNS